MEPLRSRWSGATYVIVGILALVAVRVVVRPRRDRAAAGDALTGARPITARRRLRPRAEPATVRPRSGRSRTTGYGRRGGAPVDEGVCAIRPGTDVGRYARLLARTHDALLVG